MGATLALLALAACAGAPPAAPGGEGPAFRIYQFAPDAIPRIDGDPGDWAMAGEDYAMTTRAMAADDGSGRRPEPASLDISVKVGWVKGMNRLYFLYEARDDYWSFGEAGLTNDIFELVVDGDQSGGPLIARFRPDLSPSKGWFEFQNIHAQNYHIFTPAKDKDWAMAWGPQARWIKRLPWSNIAYRYHFRHGEGGRLTAEFWITPFDRADPDDPAKSIETQLRENNLIAMAWAVIDDDGPGRRAFWNLSPHHMMYGQASQLCPFRLMPLENRPFAADWSFRIVDRERRLVAFHDTSPSSARAWRWDFGDGTHSTEQHPVHRYAYDGKFVVTLEVEGPSGSARHAKVWDVSFTGDPQK